MKQLSRLVGAWLSAAVLAACGGPSAFTSAPTVGAQPSIADALAYRSATGAKLYVANYFPSSVTVYASGKNSLLRTISPGISYPDALAFDGSGNLAFASGCGEQ